MTDYDGRRMSINPQTFDRGRVSPYNGLPNQGAIRDAGGHAYCHGLPLLGRIRGSESDLESAAKDREERMRLWQVEQRRWLYARSTAE